MKTIGVIGTRKRDSQLDFCLTATAFFSIYEIGDIIISGGCPKGGDRFAELLASTASLRICVFPAKWKEYGRGAGYRRNTYIAKYSDVLIACVADDRKGGTEDTIRKFQHFYPNGQVILV